MSRRRRSGRDVHGVVLLDKPAGLTSNQALQSVKRLFNARKAGHTGSLDPIATGLLPICLGEATKVSGFLLEANKHYEVRAKLGERTNTGDAEGEVLETRPVPPISDRQLRRALKKFTGTLQQVPPMYSAIKHEGQRLYKLARQGIEVERKPREVTVFQFDMRDRDGSEEVEFLIVCSKGTYVRTLVDDLGETLGCGAHVVALRRAGVEPYDTPDMHTLDELEALAEKGLESLDEVILPTDSALAKWPAVALDPDSSFYLCRGQPVLVPRAPGEGNVRLYDSDGRFLGVGHVLEDGRVAPRRLLKLPAVAEVSSRGVTRA
ncbi:MAG: tRNA pseudouridine(55) synthase TruB [Gammaproteobacteria bacterium]|nr:MAG: tRNA pseudouridine(55) synthase TruB [Gammaproteobacteria bacterium]